MKDGQYYLMEKPDIVFQRIQFLKMFHNLKDSGDSRPIFYTDETWVNEYHSHNYICQEKRWD